MGCILQCLNLKKIDEDLIPPLNASLMRESIIEDEPIQETDEAIIDSKEEPKVKLKITDFTFLKYLGKGTFGEVALVRYKQSSNLYAMKILEKKHLAIHKQIEHTKTERDVLVKLRHPFLVQLVFAFQDSRRLFFVTEFMQGGELFFHLHREIFFDDDKTRFYICEIILALEFIHSKNFVYRDLKPENLLLDKDGHIHLTDFGLSKLIDKHKDKAFTICGTPQYLAPEVLKGTGYDNSVDWWSLGILMYEMLSGKLPFPSLCKGYLSYEMYEEALKSFNIPRNFTKEAGNIIKKLLVINPKKRLGYGKNGVNQIKKHDYFKGINWEDVYKKQIKPPFVPHITNEYDLSNFSKEFTTKQIPSGWFEEEEEDNDTKMDNEYSGFSYTSKSLIE